MLTFQFSEITLQNSLSETYYSFTLDSNFGKFGLILEIPITISHVEVESALDSSYFAVLAPEGISHENAGKECARRNMMLASFHSHTSYATAQNKMVTNTNYFVGMKFLPSDSKPRWTDGSIDDVTDSPIISTQSPPSSPLCGYSSAESIINFADCQTTLFTAFMCETKPLVFYATPATWLDAHSASLNNGLILPSFVSDDHLAVAAYRSGSVSGHLWVGGNEQLGYGAISWVNGIPTTDASLFAAGEPSVNPGIPQCTALDVNTKKLFQTDCTSLKPSITESQFVQFATTEPVTYEIAKQMCASIQRFLPIVSTLNQHTDLLSSLGLGSDVWLGVDKLTSSNYIYNDGTVVLFSGSTTSFGAPWNEGNEDCVMVGADGSWSAKHCTNLTSVVICNRKTCGNGLPDPSEGCDTANATTCCSGLCSIETGCYCDTYSSCNNCPNLCTETEQFCLNFTTFCISQSKFGCNCQNFDFTYRCKPCPNCCTNAPSICPVYNTEEEFPTCCSCPETEQRAAVFAESSSTANCYASETNVALGYATCATDKTYEENGPIFCICSGNDGIIPPSSSCPSKANINIFPCPVITCPFGQVLKKYNNPNPTSPSKQCCPSYFCSPSTVPNPTITPPSERLNFLVNPSVSNCYGGSIINGESRGTFTCGGETSYCLCASGNEYLLPPGTGCEGAAQLNAVPCPPVPTCPIGYEVETTPANIGNNVCCPSHKCILSKKRDVSRAHEENLIPSLKREIPLSVTVPPAASDLICTDIIATYKCGSTTFCSCDRNGAIIIPRDIVLTNACVTNPLTVTPCPLPPSCPSPRFLSVISAADPTNGVCCPTYACLSPCSGPCNTTSDCRSDLTCNTTTKICGKNVCLEGPTVSKCEDGCEYIDGCRARCFCGDPSDPKAPLLVNKATRINLGEHYPVVTFQCACPPGFEKVQTPGSGNTLTLQCVDTNECNVCANGGSLDICQRDSGLGWMYSSCHSWAGCVNFAYDGTLAAPYPPDPYYLGFHCAQCPANYQDAGRAYAISLGLPVSSQDLASGKNCAMPSSMCTIPANINKLCYTGSQYGLCNSAGQCAACTSATLTRDFCESEGRARSARNAPNPTAGCVVSEPVLEFCLCGNYAGLVCVDSPLGGGSGNTTKPCTTNCG